MVKVLVLVLLLGGCSNLNLAKTIAGGECGTVDYRITVLGTPLLGIQAERECIEDSKPEVSE